MRSGPHFGDPHDVLVPPSETVSRRRRWSGDQLQTSVSGEGRMTGVLVSVMNVATRPAPWLILGLEVTFGNCQRVCQNG